MFNARSRSLNRFGLNCTTFNKCHLHGNTHTHAHRTNSYRHLNQYQHKILYSYVNSWLWKLIFTYSYNIKEYFDAYRTTHKQLQKTIYVCSWIDFRLILPFGLVCYRLRYKLLTSIHLKHLKQFHATTATMKSNQMNPKKKTKSKFFRLLFDFVAVVTYAPHMLQITIMLAILLIHTHTHWKKTKQPSARIEWCQPQHSGCVYVFFFSLFRCWRTQNNLTEWFDVIYFFSFILGTKNA